MTAETADEELVDLVRRARDGDGAAWEVLLARFGPLLRYVAREFPLNAADASDVVQTTWLRLLEHIDGIREPAHLAAWLCTTTRRECLRVLRLASRVVLTDQDLAPAAAAGPGASPEEAVISSEERAALWDAVHRLPDRHRGLLRVLMSSPAPSYGQVAQALAMPIGSIGPTRARGIEQLRRDPRIKELAI